MDCGDGDGDKKILWGWDEIKGTEWDGEIPWERVGSRKKFMGMVWGWMQFILLCHYLVCTNEVCSCGVSLVIIFEPDTLLNALEVCLSIVERNRTQNGCTDHFHILENLWQP